MATVRAEALHWRMARLIISVPPNPPAGYALELNGTPVPTRELGCGVASRRGALTLEASAPGYETFRRSVLIPSLDAAHVGVTMQRLEPTPRRGLRRQS